MEQGEGIAGAAELLGIVEAENPRLGRLAVQIARQFAGGFPFIDMGGDFLRDEPAHRVADRLVAFIVMRRARTPLVEQRRFHRASPRASAASPRAGPCICPRGRHS